MADVFISYAREDQPFVRRLQEALTARGTDVWVDWEDIPPTAEWISEVERAIEDADSFVLVVSPHSVASEVCRHEIEHAAAQGKRLVPVVRSEPDLALVPEAARAHNWIFCRDTDDFDAAVDAIVTALRTDLGWVHAHTRLLVRAIEWDTNRRDGSFLLRGRDLEAAERWLGESARHETPKPTDLQIEYLGESRQGAKRSSRIRFAAVSVGLVVALTLAVVAFLQRDEARRQTTIARARELVASSTAALPSDPELSLWFAAQAERTERSVEADRLLRQALLESRVRHVTPPDASQRPRYTVRAISPDLRHAVIDHDRDTRPAEIRDLRTGTTVTPLGVTSGELFDASFSPTGRKVVTNGGAITVWDTRSGAPLTRLADNGFPSFSFDGTRIIVASAIGGSSVYASDGATLAVLPVEPSGAALNRDGTLAVTWESCSACADPAVVWDATSAIRMFELGSNGADVAAFSPTGAQVATGDKHGVVRVFDLSNPAAPVAERRQHTGSVNSIEFSRDGSHVVSGSSDRTAQVWDLASGTSFSLRGHVASIEKVAFSTAGDRVATVHSDQSVRTWDAAPLRPRQRALRGSPAAPTARFDARGRRVLARMTDGTVVVWHPQSGRRLLTTSSRVRAHGAVDAAMSDDGRVVVATTRDGRTAKVWDVRSGRARVTLQGHGDIFRSPALDAGGRRAATMSKRAVRIWDTRSGGLVRLLPVARVVEATFGPGGDVLVLATDRSSSLWLTTTGERVARLAGRGDVFRRPRFSPDGTLVATQSADGTDARVFDTFSGTLRRSGFGPGSGASGEQLATTAFSADGRQLLTVYNFGRIRVWDIASGRLLIEPPYETLIRAYVADVAFSADRTRVSVLSEYSNDFTYECPLCASTPRLLELSERRVSDEIKRNARTLSLQ